MLNRKLLAITCFIFSIGCNMSPAGNPNADILITNMDTSINPADDFFLYANGSWLKKTPIPATESSWGIGDLVQEDIYLRLRKINEDAQLKKPQNGSVSQKIADFWYSGMDTVNIEKQALAPLRAAFDEIDGLAKASDLARLAASFDAKGIPVLFDYSVYQDDMNSDKMAFVLSQGGIGMPDRDYYFNTDKGTVSVRNAYKIYMAKTFRQLGADSSSASRSVRDVFDLESGLAKSSRKLADLRDPYLNYHKMSVDSLSILAPAFEWTAYFKQVGVPSLDSVVVGQPEFFTTLSSYIKTTSLKTWKEYLKFHLVRRSARYLDSITYRNNFEYQKTLTGTSFPRPRWKRILDYEENAMGEALGQLFVKEYFPEKTRKRYSELVEAIRGAYKDRIGRLSWMSDSTKKKALEKLAMMSKKVGYPDRWKDFSSMHIDRGPLILNIFHAREWLRNYENNKIGRPVDRTEWEMSPQAYNAYYNPANNEIVLPAGIFIVPGKRDEELDDALVYGYAAASTIGHEITHGFDDQGRQFDIHGNLKNWWGAKDEQLFKDKARLIIRQYNMFNPVDTLHINGDATQGENIADLGGMLLGLDAFKKTAAYRDGKSIGGLTPLQRYFLGYAYGWLYAERNELIATNVMTDEHSPVKERVNGPVMNVPEFYEAFHVQPGSRMFLADSLRVFIW